MTFVMAVSCRGGAVLAAGVDPEAPVSESGEPAAVPSTSTFPTRRVVKAPWGLVAGTAAPEIVGALRTLLHRSRVPSPDDVLPFSRTGGEGAGVQARWLFTYEPPESGGPRGWAGAMGAMLPAPERMGAPISLYRSSPHGHVRLSWGAVLLPEALDPEVGREGTLRLHAALDEDGDPQARFAAVVDAFAWFAERAPGSGSEVDVGFHEEGHLYSVDRFAF
jgi:hypothetical protein